MIEEAAYPMGLVPGFAGYPSSTFVGMEQMGEMVLGLGEKEARLSMDEVTDDGGRY